MTPRLKDPNVMRMAGFLALALASSSHYLPRISPASENLADFLMGLFITIGVGFFALSMRPRRPC